METSKRIMYSIIYIFLQIFESFNRSRVPERMEEGDGSIERSFNGIRTADFKMYGANRCFIQCGGVAVRFRAMAEAAKG